MPREAPVTTHTGPSAAAWIVIADFLLLQLKRNGIDEDGLIFFPAIPWERFEAKDEEQEERVLETTLRAMWWAEEDVARTEKAMMVVSSYVLYFSEEFVFWIRERKVRKVRPRLIFCVKSKMFLNFMVQLYMEVINSLLVRDDESTLFRGVSFQMRIRKPPRFSFSHSLSSLSLSRNTNFLSLFCVCV